MDPYLPPEPNPEEEPKCGECRNWDKGHCLIDWVDDAAVPPMEISADAPACRSHFSPRQEVML